MTRSFLGRQEGEPAEKREAAQTEPQSAGRENQARRQEIERKIAEGRRRSAELRVDAMRQQIEELRNAGRNDEAAKLEIQLREYVERETRGRVSAEELENQAREVQGRRERAVPRGDRPEEAGPADLERRLNHLLEAAENLMAAGLPEQAEQLRRQAETMRAKFGEHSDRRPELQELHNQLRQQNERIERLEQIVHKLLEHSATSSVAPSAPAAVLEIDSKINTYARAALKKYDKNGDGTLTKDEWSSMSKDPSAADKDGDGDGKITATEYAVWSTSR